MPRKAGMGSHSRPGDGETFDWYTPRSIFDALGVRFDLDPCAPPLPIADWIPAARRYSLPSDGLILPWKGRVWLNPPYGPRTIEWMRRLAEHGDGIALIFARTETAWWHEVVPSASAVCFIRGRLTFVRADGTLGESNAGAPSALVAFGEGCAEAVKSCGLGMVFCPEGRAFAGQASLWGAT